MVSTHVISTVRQLKSNLEDRAHTIEFIRNWEREIVSSVVYIDSSFVGRVPTVKNIDEELAQTIYFSCDVLKVDHLEEGKVVYSCIYRP